MKNGIQKLLLLAFPNTDSSNLALFPSHNGCTNSFVKERLLPNFSIKNSTASVWANRSRRPSKCTQRKARCFERHAADIITLTMLTAEPIKLIVLASTREASNRWFEVCSLTVQTPESEFGTKCMIASNHVTMAEGKCPLIEILCHNGAMVNEQ